MEKEIELPLLFLDLETTGHDPLRRLGDKLVLWHEIIEIGAVAATSKTLEVLDVFETKVIPKHPRRCIPNIINHYPDRACRGEWKDAVPLASAIRELLAFCLSTHAGPFVLVGQNFCFDWSFLSVALTQCRFDSEDLEKFFHYAKLDTRSMAIQKLMGTTGYDPKEFSLRAGLVQKHLGIQPEPKPHTALNGAYQAYELYKALRAEKIRHV